MRDRLRPDGEISICKSAALRTETLVDQEGRRADAEEKVAKEPRESF